VCIIPHTAGLTTVGFKAKGERVNIEADMIGKYVERFLSARQGSTATPPSGVTVELLARAGFMK
jgi:riboflavin synthase